MSSAWRPSPPPRAVRRCQQNVVDVEGFTDIKVRRKNVGQGRHAGLGGLRVKALARYAVGALPGKRVAAAAEVGERRHGLVRVGRTTVAYEEWSRKCTIRIEVALDAKGARIAAGVIVDIV